MTTRTQVLRAIGLAIRITTVVTMAAAAVATTAPAQAGSPGHDPAAGDGFMPIHMANQRIGSAVAAYWQAQAATSEVAAIAQDKPMWQLQTDSAYLTVFAYHCAPGMLDRAALAVEPNGIEVAIYTDRFRIEYGSNCRAFYLSEVAARIDQPTGQAMVEAGRP